MNFKKCLIVPTLLSNSFEYSFEALQMEYLYFVYELCYLKFLVLIFLSSFGNEHIKFINTFHIITWDSKFSLKYFILFTLML